MRSGHISLSNNLRTGVAKVRQMLNEGLKLSLGTDASAGYATSILNAIRTGYFAAISRSIEHPSEKYLKLAEMLYIATLGGADVLGMKDMIGNFVTVKIFDSLITDPLSNNSPIDLLDHDDISVLKSLLTMETIAILCK
ncbi:hypothetical protein K7432_015814 [Basidiobolus ranarum]|uniref:Amidohydrolase-related domain-containing protein n=1 Tax=Basidiobolus ranarum TaxID=34480 RepID=A0ABR2WFM1_9FUNG